MKATPAKPASQFVGLMRHQRLALGITQQELADRIGRSRSYVATLEYVDSPQRAPSKQLSAAIAKALSLDASALWECAVRDHLASLDPDVAAHLSAVSATRATTLITEPTEPDAPGHYWWRAAPDSLLGGLVLEVAPHPAGRGLGAIVYGAWITVADLTARGEWGPQVEYPWSTP